MKTLFFLLMVIIVNKVAAKEDFTVQLPPIPTVLTIEDVDLPPIKKWPSSDANSKQKLNNYFLSSTIPAVVISVSVPEPKLPVAIVLPNENKAQPRPHG